MKKTKKTKETKKAKSEAVEKKKTCSSIKVLANLSKAECDDASDWIVRRYKAEMLGEWAKCPDRVMRGYLDILPPIVRLTPKECDSIFLKVEEEAFFYTLVSESKMPDKTVLRREVKYDKPCALSYDTLKDMVRAMYNHWATAKAEFKVLKEGYVDGDMSLAGKDPRDQEIDDFPVASTDLASYLNPFSMVRSDGSEIAFTANKTNKETSK